MLKVAVLDDYQNVFGQIINIDEHISKYEFNFKERKIVLNILYEYCLNKNLNLIKCF